MIDNDGDPAAADAAAGNVPYLRITSTFPTDDGRVETLTLEVNLRDVDPAGETWLRDLVTATIRELRGTVRQPRITLTGPGVPGLFADHMAHAKDCDGSCGRLLPTVPTPPTGADDVRFMAARGYGTTTLGHAGSDRWTGGDRRDGN